MNVRLISPARSIMEEVISCLPKEERDFSSQMVVFPGRRPAHFLRKALSQQIGRSFIPPRIFSMDEFVDFIFEKTHKQRKLEAIDAVALLYDIHRKSTRPLGGTSFLTPDSFFPIGLKIYRDLEELRIEGLDHRHVREIEPYYGQTIPENAVKMLQSLSLFYEGFYRIIEEKGFSTRSARYHAASLDTEGAGLDRFRQIIFAGFFALTRYEKDLFGRLLLHSNTLFIFQEGEGIGERLEEIGIRAENSQSDSAGPEISFYSSPDTHGQIYTLGNMLEKAAQKGDVLTERSAVVLPASETLFPLLRHGLSFASEEDINVSLGYPLLRTPVYGFLNNLMELITSMNNDRIYAPDYLRFVLHPYTKNIYFDGDAETTRILFHALEEGLTRRRTRTFSTLPDIIADEALFALIAEKMKDYATGITKERLREHLRTIHLNTIEKFLSFEDVGDFSGKCADVLTYIYRNSTARLHPLFHPFSESFIRALDVISGSLMKDVSFSERQSYFTFFRKYIMTCHSPFEGTPVRGLQILGFLETRALKFDRVFVLDVNEETLPDTKKQDSLLPFKARELLGLPTYRDRDRLTAYYFDILVKGAKEVHLFFIENDTKEKSRFAEKLLWEKQKKERQAETGHYIKSVQYRVNLKNALPGEIAKTAAITEYLKTFPFSATSVDRYLQCQQQFYYSHILGLSRRDGISEGVERADIGKFVHRAVSAYFETKTGVLLKEKDIDELQMQLLTDDLFTQEYGKDPSGSVYLLKQQIRRRLGELLKSYYLPLIREKNVTVISSEEKIEIRSGSFFLKGRLDRVEKRDGRICIVDYKTGSNLNPLKISFDKLDPGQRESWEGAIGSLQLPFYLMLYAGHTGINMADMDAMFLILGGSGIDRDMELPLCDGQDRTERYGMLADIIRKLLQEITDPSLPFRPARSRKKACPRCDFRYICGMQWVG